MNEEELLSATLEWGSQVEDQGHLNGALELHSLAFELASAFGELDSAVDAARFQGRVHRKLAEWEEASAWYELAMNVANESHNPRKLALVLDGLGNTHRDRGNLPKAREVLTRVMALGKEHDDRYALAIAHHDLMTVEKLAGNLDDAVLHGWDAVQAYDSREGSLRALFDLAGVLRESGELSAARDAYSVVSRQVAGSEYYILSLDALAYIAALKGDETEYRRFRTLLEQEGWEEVSPVYRAQVLYYQGLACGALGWREESEQWLRKALAFAEAHGLSKLIFDAEEALEGHSSPWKESGAVSLLPDPGGEGITNVRQGLREMRETLAGAGS
jgi:tetratricopeptide (TPR) repeat protein